MRPNGQLFGRVGKKFDRRGHDGVVRASRIEELFRLYAADVLAYALRRTDAASADDVVAEVFATAWRRLDRIPEQEPVLWLYAVARRVLANNRRSLRRRLALHEALRPLTVEELAPSGLRLGHALGALKATDREVLLLTAWEGLDANQVAEVLGCSVQAVYTRLHRAKRRLAAQLQPQDGTLHTAEVNAP